MMMPAGMLPTYENLMYIWNTLADSAGGVASKVFKPLLYIR